MPLYITDSYRTTPVKSEPAESTVFTNSYYLCILIHLCSTVYYESANLSLTDELLLLLGRSTSVAYE